MLETLPGHRQSESDLILGPVLQYCNSLTRFGRNPFQRLRPLRLSILHTSQK
jgi:hypothetical protein